MIVGIGDNVLRRVKKWCGPKLFVQAHETAVAVLQHIHVKPGVIETARDLINFEEQRNPHQEQDDRDERLALPAGLLSPK